jgi:hypothetical protein
MKIQFRHIHPPPSHYSKCKYSKKGIGFKKNLRKYHNAEEEKLRIFLILYFFIYINPIGMVGLISSNKKTYLERLRDWPVEARQPAMQGANSCKMVFILVDKVFTGFSNTFPKMGKVFFVKRRRIKLNAAEREELISHLENMLVSLQFGSITLVVQDGKIVQIEKNEKVRLKQNKIR